LERYVIAVRCKKIGRLVTRANAAEADARFSPNALPRAGTDPRWRARSLDNPQLARVSWVVGERQPGERLTSATMFAQSNDLFYAPQEDGIALFDATGKPIRGDVTSQILLWDAGAEVNEEPGLGPNQAPLQAAPNTGPAENGVVRSITEVKDGFHYPTVPQVLRVTITPGPPITR